MIEETEILIIDCPFCKAGMGTLVRGQLFVSGDDEGNEPFKVSLVQCPKCKAALVGLEQMEFGVFEDPKRVWPLPPVRLNWKIPMKIRHSLEESHRCLKNESFTASVAMSGRALEGLVRHFTHPTMGLQNGIKELHTQKIIDDRLNEWANALHLDRNEAAHFSGRTFLQQDAEDIFKFANNICEYVFVLSKEFEDFKMRKAQKP